MSLHILSKIAAFCLLACSLAVGQTGQPRKIFASGPALTTVVGIGSCQLNFSSNCVITLPNGAASGTGIVIVGYSTAAPVSTSIAVANSGTANTWQADIFANSQSTNSAYIANAIASSGTITITPNAGGSDDWGFIAYQLSSMASSSWLDASIQQTMTYGTTGSITTSATAHQPNINLLNCGSGTANTDTVSGYAFVGPSGTVNTSGTAVTFVSGSRFQTTWTGTITINGTGYTISSVGSATSVTLTGSAGTQTGVAYSYGTSTGMAGITPSRLMWSWWERVTSTGTQSATLVRTTNDNPVCQLLSYKAN